MRKRLLPGPGLLEGAARLVARGVPARDRDAVLGDLREEAARLRRGSGAAWQLGQLLRISAWAQAEPWRDPEVRPRALATGLAAVMLLLAVPAASGVAFGGPVPFSGPVSLLVVELWRASHLTAAAAAGLLVGRAPWIAPHAAPVRWQVGALLVALAWTSGPGGLQGLLAAVVLAGALLAGERAGRDVSGRAA